MISPPLLQPLYMGVISLQLNSSLSKRPFWPNPLFLYVSLSHSLAIETLLTYPLSLYRDSVGWTLDPWLLSSSPVSTCRCHSFMRTPGPPSRSRYTVYSIHTIYRIQNRDQRQNTIKQNSWRHDTGGHKYYWSNKILSN